MPVGFDIFHSDPFSAVSMTEAVNKMGYVPSFLRTLPGLIVPKPVRTTQIFIEQRENAPALIQTDNRGAPPAKIAGDRRSLRGFNALRVAQGSTITADSLQNIRGFGSETDLQAVQVEVANRQAIIGRNIDLTEENLFLGLVQGTVLDADGTTTLFDWASEFGQTIPTEVDFDLDNASPASGAVRKVCNGVTRTVRRNLKGMGGNAVSIYAICGDAFWDDLTAHSEVRQTYLNTMAAADLREGNAWETFRYGGIVWSNYRGTDDGSTLAVNTDKAKFFPTGAGIFQMAYAPAEGFEFVNTLGKPRYSQMVFDKDRNAWVDVEMSSYPLPVCVQPSALHRGRRT